MNIVEFKGANNLNDIVAMARRFADDVESGQYGTVNTVVLAVETDEGMQSFGWGAADDAFKVIGMFQTAAHTHMTEIVV